MFLQKNEHVFIFSSKQNHEIKSETFILHLRPVYWWYVYELQSSHSLTHKFLHLSLFCRISRGVRYVFRIMSCCRHWCLCFFLVRCLGQDVELYCIGTRSLSFIYVPVTKSNCYGYDHANLCRGTYRPFKTYRWNHISFKLLNTALIRSYDSGCLVQFLVNDWFPANKRKVNSEDWNKGVAN